MTEARLSFGVLGPLEVRAEGRLVVVPGQRQRLVLPVLVLNAGSP